MVGLVIVSHSRALAEALANLVRQIASQDIPLAVTGGVGADRQEFGTDAVEIMEAIQAVDGPDGVLVLMDLGSAVLSAEMALEFLDPEIVVAGHYSTEGLSGSDIPGTMAEFFRVQLETERYPSLQVLLYGLRLLRHFWRIVAYGKAKRAAAR